MLRVFALRNAEAKSAADVLARVFVDDAMQVAADERTNSVLVRAPRERCDEIEALLLRLDEAK